MKISWYEYLRQTRIYAAFLAHRVWSAEKILAVPLLGCFPLGSLVLTWVMLPILVITLLTLAAFVALGETIWLMVLYACTAFYIVALGPITVVVLPDLFPWYFSVLWAVFGKKQLAEQNLRKTKADLIKWQEKYG